MNTHMHSLEAYAKHTHINSLDTHVMHTHMHFLETHSMNTQIHLEETHDMNTKIHFLHNQQMNTQIYSLVINKRERENISSTSKSAAQNYLCPILATCLNRSASLGSTLIRLTPSLCLTFFCLLGNFDPLVNFFYPSSFCLTTSLVLGNTVLECSVLVVFCLPSLTLRLAFCSHHFLFLASSELSSSLVLCLACNVPPALLGCLYMFQDCSRSNMHSSPQPSTVMLSQPVLGNFQPVAPGLVTPSTPLCTSHSAPLAPPVLLLKTSTTRICIS